MKSLSIALLASMGLSLAASAGAQNADAHRFASEVCASCHGPRGVSVSPAFPNLAGQTAEYVETQLKAFRDHSRADPMAEAFMWGMASQLSDATISDLATYYAAQPPARKSRTDPALVRAGEAIFLQGVPAIAVIACQTCHGAQAQGNATIPRLADQHAEYIVKQLVLFKSELRADASAPIMHAESHGMTFDQMEAVAAYLASR
jgi:cytochrome c553